MGLHGESTESNIHSGRARHGNGLVNLSRLCRCFFWMAVGCRRMLPWNNNDLCRQIYTLQGINISHLGKRKIIFKMPFLGDMLIPWRVIYVNNSIYDKLQGSKMGRDPIVGMCCFFSICHWRELIQGRVCFLFSHEMRKCEHFSTDQVEHLSKFVKHPGLHAQ